MSYVPAHHADVNPEIPATNPPAPMTRKTRTREPDPHRTEVWMPVADWPAYEVSSFGRVKSYWIRIRKKGGGGFFHVIGGSGKILKASPSRKGYLRVVLYDNAGRHETKQVHQLVLETFVGPCPAGMQARHHPDVDKRNNRLANLAWGTPSQNGVDSLLAGAIPSVRLTRPDVERIWPRLVAGESHKSIAVELGVHPHTISDIARRERWSCVTKDLPGEPPPFFLQDSAVKDIWEGLVRGDPIDQLAESHGVDRATIYKVRKRETHAEITAGLPGEPMKNKRWRLSGADIPVIWGRIVAGESLTAIGKDFGVRKGLIWGIKKKRCYKQITDNLPGIPGVV
jgi:hypothetical protein